MRSQVSASISSSGSKDSIPALVTRIATRPELGADPIEGAVDRGPVGDVDLDGDGRRALGAKLVGRGLGGAGVAVEDGDEVAVGGEPAGDAETDPGRPAGDDGDAVRGSLTHLLASTGSNSMWSSLRPRRTQVGS